MTSHRRSYWKTVVIAGMLGSSGLAVSAGLAFVFVRFEPWPITARLAWISGTSVAVGAVVWMVLVVAGGLIALHRDRLEDRGLPYVVRTPRERASRPGGRTLRRWIGAARSTFRGSPGPIDLRPGDPVEVRSLDEVLATLDDQGLLDGMPFMPEMAAFCGRRSRVFRRVDKMNDWVRKTGLRRVRGTVLLEHLRCDGAAHGGCQASCHLRWKEAWLRPVCDGRPTAVDREAGPSAVRAIRPGEADLQCLAERLEESGETRYICQATELTSGTSPLAWGDPRHYLCDVLRGNVAVGPFLVGVSLLCFNWAQRTRGGVRYPNYVPAARNPTPQSTLGLQAGEFVRVKTKREIEETLSSESRNRGLWFDAEMLRFCGGEYRVQKRVERLIVEQTGKLVQLKNACILLDGVTSTGEYLAFNPENESIFWREIWLERVQANPPRS